MSREPGFPPPQPVEKVDNKLITEVRHYKLITPLYGGGVKPAKADPVTTIRGTEVRGHLRFWWRATRGGGFDGDLQKMKEAEDLLWGAASGGKNDGPSPIQISVEVTNHGKPFIARGNDGNEIAIGHVRSPYSYVAFPLRNSVEKLIEGIEFTLTILYPHKDESSIKPELEATLWAWETFGGIGARTRRGFGALQRIDRQPELSNDVVTAKAQLLEKIQDHSCGEKWPPSVPHLIHQIEPVSLNPNNAIETWKKLFNKLKSFRQQRSPGTQPNRPGRSKWPEPNAIRKLTGETSHNHTPPANTLKKFPRAQFGLPIIFEFNRQQPNQQDPGKRTLQGAGNIERLASPLILRPVACQGGKFVGIAAILDTPREPPYGLELEGVSTTLHSNITTTELASVSPLNAEGETDPLQAFLKYLIKP